MTDRWLNTMGVLWNLSSIDISILYSSLAMLKLEPNFVESSNAKLLKRPSRSCGRHLLYFVENIRRVLAPLLSKMTESRLWGIPLNRLPGSVPVTTNGSLPYIS